ncbi:aldolase/citrate lyase family protein [Rhodococcus sp. 3Y1]
MSAQEFAARIRGRERILGYWSVIDSPISTEWIAHVGWDYIALDMQHGLIGYSGMVAGLTAIDSSPSTVGMVRVEANNPTPIGRALDAGAVGVIVPLINNAEEAAAAVAAAKYPPSASAPTDPCARNPYRPCSRRREPRHRCICDDRDPTGSGERRRDLRSARIGRRVRRAVRPTNRRRR